MVLRLSEQTFRTSLKNKMTLDELRKKAIYQNTVDTWIAACEEKNVEWYETENYKKFISYLTNNKLKMQKFSL